jgi:hypothetical protein
MAVVKPHGYAPAMPNPEGFHYIARGDLVLIPHHGRAATTLRGRRAQVFLEDVESSRRIRKS